jgi:aspartate kinase
MKQKIVGKFGGTSMKDAEAMVRSAKISKDHQLCVVVVSATSGTTNLLESLAENALAQNQVVCDQILNELKNRHLKMAQDLKLSAQSFNELQKIFLEQETLCKGMALLKECSAKAMDSLYSTGERLSSVLFTKALQNHWPERSVHLLDARHVIRTDDTFKKAKPDFNAIARLALEFLPNLAQNTYVTQGFIGATEQGHTTTLGRGGSDYSAALFAEGIDADILEIWTDVAGIATTDPRICPEAQLIAEISFQEASELATFGAKILHPTTLAPAMRKDIPVFVGSSFEPEKPGTWIRRESQTKPLVRAMAIRNDQGLLTVSTPKMLNAYGYLGKIFDIFGRHKVSVDAITTSEISVAVTVHKNELSNRALLEDLKEIAEIEIEDQLSLVSLIGNDINHTPGLAVKIFQALENINVRMICHGASRHNFCFLVAQKDGHQTISRLHQRFIK